MEESIRAGIKQIVEELDIPEDKLIAEFEKMRASDEIVSNEYLATDEQKDSYCLLRLRAGVSNRAEAKEYKCVPIGFGGLRKSIDKKTDKEKIWCEIFALFPSSLNEGNEGDETPTVRRISVYHNPEVYKELGYGTHAYSVVMSKFQDGSYRINDNRSEWVNPQALGDVGDILDFIPKIKVVDIPSNVARKVKDYVDSTDWRCLVGIVTQTSVGDRKDGFGKWGSLEVGDGSLLEPVEADAKRTLYPSIRIWCPTELIPNVQEKVAVYGTVAMGDDGFTMQAFMVKRLVKLGP